MIMDPNCGCSVECPKWASPNTPHCVCGLTSPQFSANAAHAVGLHFDGKSWTLAPGRQPTDCVALFRDPGIKKPKKPVVACLELDKCPPKNWLPGFQAAISGLKPDTYVVADNFVRCPCREDQGCPFEPVFRFCLFHTQALITSCKPKVIAICDKDGLRGMVAHGQLTLAPQSQSNPAARKLDQAISSASNWPTIKRFRDLIGTVWEYRPTNPTPTPAIVLAHPIMFTPRHGPQGYSGPLQQAIKILNAFL